MVKSIVFTEKTILKWNNTFGNYQIVLNTLASSSSFISWNNIWGWFWSSVCFF